MQRLWATRYSHARRFTSRESSAQRAVGADEHVLQHVLGVLPRAGAQHLAHVGEQPLAIAVVDRAERVVAPAAEQRQQLLVRAQPEQRTARAEAAPSAGWCVECGRFHCRRL